MTIILSPPQLKLIIKRMAHELLEEIDSLDDVLFIGIQPRGIFVSNAIIEEMKLLAVNKTDIRYGILDISFYRDDVRKGIHLAQKTEIDFSVENKRVILIDDVLYTGRTIRAALDALQDFGRPKQVQLAVLIDRRFTRELPIQADFCGIAIDTEPIQKVKVNWATEEVQLYE